MKFLFSILFIICCIFITACNKLNNGKKIVRNESSSNLKILRYKKLFPGEAVSEVFTLQSKQEIIIESISGRGGPYYVGGCGNTELDSLVVELSNDPMRKVSKNLNNSNSWVFTKRAHSSGINTECKATITDADIVLK